MNLDIKNAIFDSLQKYLKHPITTEVLQLMSEEANLTLKLIYPQFSNANLIECYYVESERKIKFLLHKVH